MEELSDETKAAVVRQVEYYFSDENLATDAFMKKKMKAGGAQGEEKSQRGTANGAVAVRQIAKRCHTA